MKAIKKKRFIIQIAALIAVIFLGYLHKIKGGGPSGSPSADSLCIFGGLETLYSYITKGTIINRVEMSSVVFLIVTVIVTLLFGRLFCSFLCPLGTLQDMASKFKVKKVKVPNKIHKVLSYAKYFILAGILILTYSTGELVIRAYDPYASLMHITSAEVFTEFTIGIIILAAIIISSIFIERAFCRYFCPLGAFLSILNKIRPFKLQKSNSCIKCSKCSRECPMGIDVMNENSISNSDCISCFNCTECPAQAIEVKSSAFKLSVKKAIAASLITAAFVFSIFYFTGNFSFSRTTSKMINQNGTVNVDNIKGYMTLKEISEAINIDTETLYKLLQIPSSVPDNTPIKEVNNIISGFSVEEAREILKENIK